jgi:hypothetical protein
MGRRMNSIILPDFGKLFPNPADATKIVQAYARTINEYGDWALDSLFPHVRLNVIKAAEQAGIIVSQAQLDEMTKYLKEATKKYEELLAQGDIDPGVSNPGGSAYWKRIAGAAQEAATRGDAIAHTRQQIEETTDKINRASADRDSKLESTSRLMAYTENPVRGALWDKLSGK